MPAVVDYVSSWRARLQSRLYLQFKDDPTWNLWCTDVLGPQFQDLEDAAQTLLLFFSIADVAGVQLDLIGRIVGQPRGGIDDPTYRLYLAARLAANSSDGGPESLFNVFLALLNLQGPGHFLIVPGAAAAGSPGQASFEFRLLAPVTHAQGAAGVGFLLAAEEAGVRGILEWQEQSDALTFTLANAAILTAGVVVGGHVLTVDQTATLPATGTLRIDDGLGNAETIAYDAITSGTTLHTPSALAQNHSAGAAAELTTDAGLGLGDNTNGAIGGQLAAAADH